jgi:Tfp pilus assembly protein PilN
MIGRGTRVCRRFVMARSQEARRLLGHQIILIGRLQAEINRHAALREIVKIRLQSYRDFHHLARGEHL